MIRLHPSVLFLSASFLGSVLLACGGAGGGAAPKAAEPAQGPIVPTSAAPEDKTVPPVPSTTSGTSNMKMLEATRELDEGTAAFKAAGKDCATLCKALASMTRAADRICALTTPSSEGADKQRCDDARAKVSEATQTVKSTCGACASP